MSKYLDTIHESSDQLRYVVLKLNQLSDAFYLLGNNKVGEQLFALSNIVETAVEDVNRAVGEELNRSIQTAEDFNKTIIESALAGIKVGKGEA